MGSIKWTSEAEVIDHLGAGIIAEVVTAVVDFLHFDQRVASSVSTLVQRGDVLDLFMDRRVSYPIFRGMAVDSLDPFSGLVVGVEFNWCGPFGAASWSANESMARSFAASPAWRETIGSTGGVGVVMELTGEVDPGYVLLVPPAQTAGWFERRVKDQLLPKALQDRAKEREVLLRGTMFPVRVTDVFVL